MKQTAIFLLAVLLLSLFAGCSTAGTVPTAPAHRAEASASAQTEAPADPYAPPETFPFAEPTEPDVPATVPFSEPVFPDTPAFADPTLQNVVGSYTLVSLNGKDVKSALLEYYDEEEFAEFLEYFGLTEDNLNDLMKLSLNADGTCTIEEFGEAVTCSWTMEGSNVFLTYDGETITGTWSNGLLTLDSGDEEEAEIRTMGFQKID